MKAETAHAIAHELFRHECPEGKPHSRRCQQAAVRLEEWCEQRRLIEALIAAHQQVDLLMAMLVRTDPAFLPSKSDLWPGVVARHDLIQQHREARVREGGPGITQCITKAG